MNCKEAIDELMRAIDGNAPISEPTRAHLRQCDRCRALLASISEELPAEDAAVENSAIAAEAAVAHERKKLTIQRGIAICVTIFIFSLLMLIPLRSGHDLGVGERTLIALIGVFIAIIAGAPLLLLFSAVASARTPKGERRFYKRLGPGRWIEGVCLGMAEAMRWRVMLVRLAFVVLIWFKGLGLLAYIVCALAMPVHPADRHYLLRFRIARWWRRMRYPTEDAQQHG